MPNPTNEKRECLCQGKPANPTDCNPSICQPSIQGVRRIDYFAGIAMAGILAGRPEDAFALCDDGNDLALAASHAARAMEMAAMAMGAGL